MLELCERENLAALNRSPLAMGVLTGKYNAETQFAKDDVRSHVPWYIWFKDGKPSQEHLQKLCDASAGNPWPAKGAAWRKVRWPGSGDAVTEPSPSPVSRTSSRQRRTSGL